MNEITKYNNRMNAVNFTGFGKVDSNIFFSICTKMKNKGTNKAKFTFAEIKTLSNYTGTTIEPFVRDLEASYDKMLELKIRVGDDKEFVKFNLFNYFEVSTSAQTVEVACNEHFEEILNDWTGEWTAFRLEEYVALKSTYSKHMYRLLKQWRTVGSHAWKIAEWRELLEVPDTYDMKEVSRRVLAPIQKELPSYFIGLTIEKIKSGRKITALKFTFRPENTNYGEYTEQPDTKNKAEKIADLEAKEKAGSLTAEQIALKDNLKAELNFMEERGIPDTKPDPPKRKSLFWRFFK